MTLLCPLAAAFGLGIPVPGDPGPTNILLNAWSFTDTTNWLSDHGSAPASFTNLNVSNLGAGTALVVDSTDLAWLQYNVVENNGTTNLAFKLGSVTFWFAPNWSGTNAGGTGPGVSGRLIEAGSYTEDASYGWWGLYVDPAGANLYFSGQSNDGSQATYLSAPIEWTTNRWHFIAITYSTTNSALYIDGELATNGTPVTYLPGPAAMTNGFYIGSASNGTAQAHGMFDGLATYANPLDAGTIAATYWYSFVIYDLNPMNRAYWSSAPSYITNTPTFRAISGAGYLEYVEPSSTCATNSNVWMTNVTARLMTNGTTTVVFTIMGGDPSLLYDVFGTAQLVGNNITNAQWAWLGQGSTCSRYTITNLPGGAAFLVLGTPQDSDQDGLPDALEILWTKTDPHNPDTDGDGIWDWFGPAYFGSNGQDPYALCPSGDGWSLLQAYQNGWNPNLFYTPPAPVVSVIPLPNDNGVIISWQPAPGAVTGYTILRNGVVLTNLPPNQFSFEDDSVQVYLGNSDSLIPSYQVRANYAPGSSALSAAQRPISQAYALSTAIVRGPQGQYFLLASASPNGVTTLRVFREVLEVRYPLNMVNPYSYLQPAAIFTASVSGDHFDVPVTNFVQGQYALPDSAVPLYGRYTFVCRPLGTNGTIGPLSTPSLPEAAAISAYIPFLDGSEQLRQNLVFALEAADETGPFQFRLPDNTYPICPAWIFPSSYAYASYHFPWDFGFSAYKYSFVDEFKPFEDNYFLRNFLYSPTNVSSDGSLASGVYYDPNALPPIVIPSQTLFSFPEYAYVTQGCQCTIPPLLSATDSQWIYSPYQPSHPGWANIGITNASTNLTLRTGQSNSFGLLYQSAKRLYSDGAGLHTDTLPSGGTIPEVTMHTEYFYAQAAPPQLETVGYFFGVPNRDYLPGHAGFNPTNTVPGMVAAVGQVFSVAGWAKQTVNGRSNKLAFLEQYFDKAYLAATNGSITTNQTGILSEYGEFFPTKPGLAILTTKTNSSGQRGQVGVQVVGLSIDANHDGTMDTSFFGPDYASSARTFHFWINNDFDRLKRDTDDGTNYEDSVTAAQGNNIPDCNYTNSAGYRAIPTMRDLEDFARLWTCGISSLYSNLPPGSTVSLSWGDMGSPSPANPTIDLFEAADPDGGTGYLTNATIASQQTDPTYALYKGRLGPGQSLRLDSCLFGPCWRGDHFIWCGVSNGTGALTLTIADAQNNVLAQTMAYIQLQDIKQMYERWTVGERPSVAPTNTAYLAEEDVNQPFKYEANSDTNTPYILSVHGWNMNRYDKDRFAETAFKRLYWQGYQGRFGVFRWPTTYGFTGNFWQLLTDTYNYNNGESNAWTSATGLLNKLNDLNAQYPGHVYLLAHSMGNVVAGEALRLAGTSQVVNTYVASQAAIPAHVYDSTVTNLLQFQYEYPSGLLHPLGIVNYCPYTPNIYGNWLAGNSGGVGRRVNFYNANDWALAMPRWGFDQVVKPDVLTWGHYAYLGSANDSSPWNHFVFITLFTTNNLDIANNLNDRYTVMSYAAQARSTALGATPEIISLDERLDLTTIWPTDTSGHNYGDHFWHSAQFRGDCWQEWSYWNILLRSDTWGFNIHKP